MNNNRVRILYNERNGCWEVHHGVIIPYRGQMWACKNFCRINGLTVSNIGELNSIRYTGMPLPEIVEVSGAADQD